MTDKHSSSRCMDGKSAGNRNEVTCFILSWQQVIIGQNCPEIRIHVCMYSSVSVTDPLVSTETSTIPERSGVRMPPGQLSHWSPLEGREMLFPCPIVAFCMERTNEELCLCPHLLLTSQAATVVNRNTAVPLPWAQVWSLPHGLAVEAFWHPFPISRQWLASPGAHALMGQ